MKKTVAMLFAFSLITTSSVFGETNTFSKVDKIGENAYKIVYTVNCPNDKPIIPNCPNNQVSTEVSTEITTNTINNGGGVNDSTTQNNDFTTENTTNQINNDSNSSILDIEREVVQLVNQERAKEGLSPLKIDLEISNIARIKSQDMSDKKYFSHNSPTYGSPFDMLKQFGITYKGAGENIAKGQRTAKEVVDAWMNSEGHRKNIMNPNYTHIGVGYVSTNTTYWTQLFLAK